MATVVGLSIQPNHDAPGSKNDLHLDASGNLALAIDGEAIGQHVRQRLMFWRGEWFLNPEAGVDWTRYVLGRQPSEQPIAEAVIKREVVQTPGVAEIVEFDAAYDRESRGLRIDRLALLTVFDDTVELSL